MTVVTRPLPVAQPLSVWARIETLRLPEPTRGPAECSPGCPDAAAMAEQKRLYATVWPGRTLEMLMPPVNVRDLAWYRWVTGHQAAFLGWRALRTALDQAVPSAEIVALLDLYSVLLLYAGSCPPDVYTESIRPRMMRCHAAFSGEWAPDHHGVPAALHRATAGFPAGRTARRLNQRVHAAVAERLVPQGASLLQQAGRCPGADPSTEEYALYDRFFQTQRVDVCEHAIRRQFQRWLLKVVADLDSVGLFYRGPAVSAAAGDADRQAIAALESQAVTIVRRRLRALAKEET